MCNWEEIMQAFAVERNLRCAFSRTHTHSRAAPKEREKELIASAPLNLNTGERDAIENDLNSIHAKLCVTFTPEKR